MCSAVWQRTYRGLADRPGSVLSFLMLVSTAFFLYAIAPAAPVPPDLIRAALENGARDPRYAEVYRRSKRIKPKLKYILLWDGVALEPLSELGNGQRIFLDSECPVADCYATADRRLFGGDLTRFDAIAFNGRHVADLGPERLPGARRSSQLYIYFNEESADNYPVCAEHFDNFFNVTATYRLDSDVPYTYVTVRDANGSIVGPQLHMQWARPSSAPPSSLVDLISNKTLAAAWFVSNCKSLSRREKVVKRLQEELIPYGLTVDVFGSCGPFKCSRNSPSVCNEMIEKKYYFYLALENSFSEDYVTEKLVRALRHAAVPVVLGGAQYERFLPPGSYLDAGNLSAPELAAKIARAVTTPSHYACYFRWHGQYSWTVTKVAQHVCALCAALHGPPPPAARYAHFRRWWHPNYESRCPAASKATSVHSNFVRLPFL